MKWIRKTVALNWFLLLIIEFVIALSCFFSMASEATSDHQKEFQDRLQMALKMTPDQLSAYRQPTLQYVDPIGDVALLHLIKKAEKEGIKVLSGFTKYSQYSLIQTEDQCSIVSQECQPQALREYRKQLNVLAKNPFVPYLEKPIDEDHIIKDWLELMFNEAKRGIHPQLGMSHEWSAVFMQDPHDAFHKFVRLPKLLHALAVGVSHRFMKTGQELALIKTLIAGPENSWTLNDVFLISYRLNEGNVYLTLMTIENVFAKHFLVPYREILPLTRRLKSILKGTGNDLDKFGTWYHFFGAILYGYYSGDKPSTLQGEPIGEIENLGAWVLGSKRNRQKQQLNIIGSRIGNELKRLIRLQSSAVLNKQYIREKAD